MTPSIRFDVSTRALALAAAVLGAAIAAAATLFFTGTAAPVAAAPQAYAWEYLVVDGRRVIQVRDTQALRDGALSRFAQWEHVLNGFGAEGWELVHVLGSPGDGPKEYVFKRPR